MIAKETASEQMTTHNAPNQIIRRAWRLGLFVAARAAAQRNMDIGSLFNGLAGERLSPGR
jgi:hypothetical protein